MSDAGDLERDMRVAREIELAEREREQRDAARLHGARAEVAHLLPLHRFTEAQLQFAARVLIEARFLERLDWRTCDAVGRCPVCARGPGYRAVDFGWREMHVAGYPALGCCVMCAAAYRLDVMPTLLADVKVALPDQLGPSRWRWVDLVTCPKCDWTGPATAVEAARTLSGLDVYLCRCPSCGWRRLHLDPDAYAVIGHELQRINPETRS